MSSHYPGVTGVHAAVRFGISGGNVDITARTGIADVEDRGVGQFTIHYTNEVDIRRTLITALCARAPNGTALYTSSEGETSSSVDIVTRSDAGVFTDPDVLWVKIELLPVDTE